MCEHRRIGQRDELRHFQRNGVLHGGAASVRTPTSIMRSTSTVPFKYWLSSGSGTSSLSFRMSGKCSTNLHHQPRQSSASSAGHSWMEDMKSLRRAAQSM